MKNNKQRKREYHARACSSRKMATRQVWASESEQILKITYAQIGSRVAEPPQPEPKALPAEPEPAAAAEPEAERPSKTQKRKKGVCQQHGSRSLSSEGLTTRDPYSRLR